MTGKNRRNAGGAMRCGAERKQQEIIGRRYERKRRKNDRTMNGFVRIFSISAAISSRRASCGMGLDSASCAASTQQKQVCEIRIMLECGGECI